ncbi:MAG: hypothetical protein LBD17_01215 [Endomicrobium sp.]|jgi:hypothetical protein|nr:hypothetical protein [Endomicrobium sp.]
MKECIFSFVPCFLLIFTVSVSQAQPNEDIIPNDKTLFAFYAEHPDLMEEAIKRAKLERKQLDELKKQLEREQLLKEELYSRENNPQGPFFLRGNYSFEFKIGSLPSHLKKKQTYSRIGSGRNLPCVLSPKPSEDSPLVPKV